MKKTIGILLTLSMIIVSGDLFSQTFEEYKKRESENFNKFKQQEEAFIKQMMKEQQEYIEKEDKAFREFIEKEWASYKTDAPKIAPKSPKPDVIPEYKKPEVPVKKPVDIVPVKGVVAPIPSRVPILAPVLVKPIQPKPGLPEIKVSFYGTPIWFMYDPDFITDINSIKNQNDIAKYWDHAAKTDYTVLIQQLNEQKILLNLNDFAYYLLIDKLSDALYPGNEDARLITNWFLMLRSGYGVRAGFESNEKLILLLPSYNVVYGKKFLKEGDRFLYIFGGNTGQNIRTYDKDYVGASKIIDFNITAPMNVSGKTFTKMVTFEHNQKNYSINVNCGDGLKLLYNDFPQMELSVYFNAAVSSTVKESLAASIKPIVNEMKEQEAVDFLLSLVQKGFNYKTDDDQFGREKFFFAEELFYYPFCDCEDRSVLFSYLVRELLSLDVVGLEFPGHMATAVKFNQQIPGDYVKYQNQRYTVADPTYIGAPSGSTMPQFEGVSPTLIPVASINLFAGIENKLWEGLQNEGCRPGSSVRSIVKLADNTYAVTGFYAGIATFGGLKLPDSGTLNRGFIGKIDETGKGIWVLPYISQANSVGLTVTSEKEKVYAAGSFRDNIAIGNLKAELKKNSHDSFIACISSNGNTEWITRLNLDTIPGSAPVAFSAKFNSLGAKLSISKSVENESYNGYGLFAIGDGSLLYNGIVNRVFSSTPAKLETSYANAAVAATPELLKKQTDELIEENADKGIAGLIAAVLLVKNMGATLSGNDARAALDKYNASFSKQSPNIYKNLSKINFVKNSNGVISIQTEKGSDIYFDKIRVKNNSSININTTPSGDVSVDVLSGILVGKMVVWYKLNSVKLSKKSGDMVFDYDKDHSTAKVNMKKDILQ